MSRGPRLSVTSIILFSLGHYCPMFVLVSVREVLSLKVRDLHVVAAALRALLEERLVGRVLAGAGLVVRVQELRALGDALVDRECHVPVLATLVCFRPFVGQILEGTLAASDDKQLRGTPRPRPRPLLSHSLLFFSSLS